LPTEEGSAPRHNYVICVSGTMNPPHRGHVRIGMAAAKALEGEGHTVEKIMFIPVHDNYMWNKVVAKKDASPVYSMAHRVELLRLLIAEEGDEAVKRCVASDHELREGRTLLEESPNYWAPQLPDGYLKTVPTAALISGLSTSLPELKTPGTRLGLVFGIDNLAGMTSWNRPDHLLARSDLILVGRALPEVKLPKDPAPLLNALEMFEIRMQLPVSFEGRVLFGDSLGSFKHEQATGQSMLTLLPSLQGDLENLSSTQLRDSIVAMTLQLEKYSIEAAPLFLGVVTGDEVLKKFQQAAVSNEWDEVPEKDIAEMESALRKCVETMVEHGYRPLIQHAIVHGAANPQATLKRMFNEGRERGEWVGATSAPTMN